MAEMLDARRTTILLAVVFVVTLMDGLDGSIVNVALPNIGDDFGMDTATIAWISIVYFMVLAGTLVAFARLAADGGVRRILAWGISIFTLASLVCGLAESFEVLLAARAAEPDAARCRAVKVGLDAPAVARAKLREEVVIVQQVLLHTVAVIVGLRLRPRHLRLDLIRMPWDYINLENANSESAQL